MHSVAVPCYSHWGYCTLDNPLEADHCTLIMCMEVCASFTESSGQDSAAWVLTR
jgi:hypothetical protein